jgi:esterase FrsA
MTDATFLQKLFVTACAVTHTTDLAARATGAAPFLPALFALRYANMGGLDREEFAQQLTRARSFRDDRWCTYWNRIAAGHADRATGLLRDLTAGSTSAPIPDICSPTTAADTDALATLTDLIAPAAAVFADHGPQAGFGAVSDLIAAHTPAAVQRPLFGRSTRGSKPSPTTRSAHSQDTAANGCARIGDHGGCSTSSSVHWPRR